MVFQKAPDDIYFMTGLKSNEFDDIGKTCEFELLKAEMRRGKKSKFTPKDKIHAFLVYLRHNFKFEKLGYDFNTSSPSVYLMFNSTA
ncbi:hypothetical protein AYI68_g3350 [Smittium mucronatum]|uniref:Transposase Helix-turn-helix domain-containing protein n=1 Tax=Smittium mucronatum TaxID=133383 RepID=A0A1R0H053_9FUNG|nr:hypothetical protein AYI68_g3350 [Smittium mucronatum]